MEEQAKKCFIINVIFVSFWAAIVFFAGKFLLQYLLPFLVSACIAALMQCPAEKISQKVKVKKGTAAAILSALVYIAVAGVIVLIIFTLVNMTGDFLSSISNLSESITDLIDRIKTSLSGVLSKISPEIRKALEKVSFDFLNGITNMASEFLSNTAASAVKKIPSLLFSSLATLVASCYIAKDFDALLKFVKGLISKNVIEKAKKIKEIIKTCVLKMITGYVLIFLLTFAEIFIGLLVLGVKNAFLISALISVVDILPVLGAGAVLIPWGLLNIAFKNTALGFGIIVLYLLVVVIRNFAEPKIVADKTGINPLFMLIAMFLGLRLFGFFGLVILPVTLVVTVKYYKSEMETS